MNVSYDIYSCIEMFQVRLLNEQIQCYPSKLLVTPTMIIQQHRERLVLSQEGFLRMCFLRIHLVGYVQNK